jgi:enterochelin esterase family protein
LKSPEVVSNNRVTFRLYAPRAQEVKLQAEGLEAMPGISPQELAKNTGGIAMTRGDNGVWAIDFGPIQPGVYRYSFLAERIAQFDQKHV